VRGSRDEAARLPELTQRWGLHLALLNFDAGDMAAGDRGLAGGPDRTARLRARVPLASHIQIADVPGRGEPGTGEINYRFLLGYLGRQGYHGYVGLEYRPSGGRPEDSFGWLEEYGLGRTDLP
jgi:hydroxypyruvate isomerase